MPTFEIKYLAITWSAQDEVTKVEESAEHLELQQTDNGWFAETTAFPVMYHYIGIQITVGDLLHKPYLMLANGEKQFLTPVKVPGENRIWWIQSDGWKSRKLRHLSSVYRTSGRIYLVAQNESIVLENNTVNFTVKELEYFLTDFKDSLWMLILDSSSVSHGGVSKESPDFIDEKIFNLFQKFTESVEKIIKKPAMVLKETIVKRPLRNVKPLPRTFREFAINPNTKLLTSRANIESYDTAENRFIFHCVKRLQYVLKTLQRIAQGQINSYKQVLEQEQLWLANLSDNNTRVVDPSVYDYEISKIDSRLADIQRRVKALITTENCYYSDSMRIYSGSYTVELGKQYGKSHTSFFANTLDGYDFKKKFGTYLVFSFPSNCDAGLLSMLHSHYVLNISGKFTKSNDKKAGNGKVYSEIHFLEIFNIEVSSVELVRMKRNRVKLEQTNWITPLSREEKEDIEREKLRATKKAKLYDELIKKASVFLLSTPAIQARLNLLGNFFTQNGVKSKSDFPNTMVFIQNSHYGSAKSNYSKLVALQGLDELMLNSLTTIESMGLVNIANLYEKWCLVKIINVLHDKFGFEIEPGWQPKLIKRVLKKQTDISFRFTAQARQLQIELTYEKTLSSGKRPDFVIDLDVKKYRKNDEVAYPRWEIEDNKKSRLILDAKFRGNVNQEHINNLVSELYHDKNYSEDKSNQVFILHPCAGVISHKSSPLDWGKHSDYGQSDGANHKFGSIFISPSFSFSRSIENLERLFGMFIQKNSVILENKIGSSLPAWHNMACISCGCSKSDLLNVMYSPTNAGNSRWVIQCDACNLRSIKTVCISCKGPLFKNGPKWTYHKTRAEQISNVVCPACEQYLTPYVESSNENQNKGTYYE